MNLHGQNLSEASFVPIARTLSKIGGHILSLDLSFNPLFRDSCVTALESVLRTSPSLAYITLEKTGLSETGATSLLRCMAQMGTIKSLNLGSNKLTDRFFERLGALFSADKLLSIESLNLSNTKMSEKAAMTLLVPIVERSCVERLNLSMNGLRCKTGSCLLSLLSTQAKSKLRCVDLGYNPIGRSLLQAIEAELVRKRSVKDQINEFCTPKEPEPRPQDDSLGCEESRISAEQNTVPDPEEKLEPAEEEVYNVVLENTQEPAKLQTEAEEAQCTFDRAPEEAEKPVGNEENITPGFADKLPPAQSRQGRGSPLRETASFQNCESDTDKSGTKKTLTSALGTTGKLSANSNYDYEKIRAKILESKNNALDFHPFYSRLRKAVTAAPSQRDTAPEEGVTPAETPAAATTILEEPADSDTLPVPKPDAPPHQATKAILRDQIQKLLSYYFALDQRNLPPDIVLTEVVNLVRESDAAIFQHTKTPVSQPQTRFAQRRSSSRPSGSVGEIRGRFIRKRNVSLSQCSVRTGGSGVAASKYETESAENGMPTRGVIQGGVEAQTYMKIVKNRRCSYASLTPKRFHVG